MNIASNGVPCRTCIGVCAVLRGLMWSVAAATVVAIGFVLFALHALKPQPGEWSQRLRFGTFEREVSVPQVMRIATHPLGLAALDGRSLDTRFGRWHFERRAADTLVATCAPCSMKLAALGSTAVSMPRAQLLLTRAEVDRFRGELRIGGGDDAALLIRWKAKLHADGLAIDAELPPQSIANAIRAFGAQQVPELSRARIEGELRGSFTWKLPGGAIKPSIAVTAFDVAGLGTEALLDVALPSDCARGSRPAAGAGRVIGWLPRAVVAAEDQHFFEHPGYDLGQMLVAWSANEAVADGAAPQGASTLTQQLAKRLFVGDERTAARKLRELLYAVEMERTLGKARILQLYLQLAPWGEGVCGAEAAARAHLRKPTERLTPLEAAWLASLLRDGGRAHAQGAIDRERVVFVLNGMRGPLPLERRAEQIELAATWLPPALRER